MSEKKSEKKSDKPIEESLRGLVRKGKDSQMAIKIWRRQGRSSLRNQKRENLRLKKLQMNHPTSGATIQSACICEKWVIAFYLPVMVR